MKPQSNSNYWCTGANIVELVCGSSPRIPAAIKDKLLYENGDASGLNIRSIQFDWKKGPSADVVALLHAHGQKPLSHAQDISATMENAPEYLAKADKEGLLRYLPKEWHRNPGPAQDNMGASADQRIGKTLAVINAKELEEKLFNGIQEITSHDHKATQVIDGNNIAAVSGRFIMQCQFIACFATAMSVQRLRRYRNRFGAVGYGLGTNGRQSQWCADKGRA
jgi:hypothetical protein